MRISGKGKRIASIQMINLLGIRPYRPILDSLKDKAKHSLKRRRLEILQSRASTVVFAISRTPTKKRIAGKSTQRNTQRRNRRTRRIALKVGHIPLYLLRFLAHMHLELPGS
jgi:hypothetical protein